jgi:protoporphyrinogen oxidase
VSMSCGCTDYTGKVKNAYYTYQEAYDNKIWTEKHFNISLRSMSQRILAPHLKKLKKKVLDSNKQTCYNINGSKIETLLTLVCEDKKHRHYYRRTTHGFKYRTYETKTQQLTKQDFW